MPNRNRGLVEPAISLPSLTDFLRKEALLIAVGFLALALVGFALWWSAPLNVAWHATRIIEVGTVVTEADGPRALVPPLKLAIDTIDEFETTRAMQPEATYAPNLIRVTVKDQDPAAAEARLTEIVDRILVEHRRLYENVQRVHDEYIEFLRAQTASWEELAGVLFKRAIRRLAPGPQSKESSPDTIVSVPLSDQRDDQSFIDTKILGLLVTEAPERALVGAYRDAIEEWRATAQILSRQRVLVAAIFQPTRVIGPIRVIQQTSVVRRFAAALIISAAFFAAVVIGVVHYGWTKLLRDGSGTGTAGAAASDVAPPAHAGADAAEPTGDEVADKAAKSKV